MRADVKLYQTENKTLNKKELPHLQCLGKNLGDFQQFARRGDPRLGRHQSGGFVGGLMLHPRNRKRGNRAGWRGTPAEYGRGWQSSGLPLHRELLRGRALTWASSYVGELLRGRALTWASSYVGLGSRCLRTLSQQKMPKRETNIKPGRKMCGRPAIYETKENFCRSSSARANSK
jgi:hypothetical protein